MATLLRAVLLCLALCCQPGLAALPTDVDQTIDAIMPDVVAWRRDFHEHPELGNREFRTAEIIADHLRDLGMEVQTEVAHTGVVGVLRGGDGARPSNLLRDAGG